LSQFECYLSILSTNKGKKKVAGWKTQADRHMQIHSYMHTIMQEQGNVILY